MFFFSMLISIKNNIIIIVWIRYSKNDKKDKSGLKNIKKEIYFSTFFKKEVGFGLYIDIELEIIKIVIDVRE